MLDFSKSYFELFGLPLGFRVDSDRLAEGFRSLQRALHPDRFANATDRERRLSLQAATQINEAYQTLRDPVRRARYLLDLHGSGPGDRGGSNTDAEFLMEQMELRETLAEARGGEDPRSVTVDLSARVDGQMKRLGFELEALFADPGPENLRAAAERVGRMQFLQKFLRDVENLEAELDESC